MTLAGHVATLGRGPGRSRSLTREEAADAMAQMLAGGADPEAVGAILMLLRMKGETADEIAGLAGAAQAAVPDLPAADLDWPCYAAGRTRGLPWFLISARLVAQAGHRVLLHGWNGGDTAVRDHLGALAIPVAATPAAIGAALDRGRIAYMPLEAGHPALFALLSLRAKLGLRSCVNTVCRMLNPGRAPASVQGVFHPSYRLLQAEAAQRLGWPALTVIKGGGGEFERNPGKEIAAFGLRGGVLFDGQFPALRPDSQRMADAATATDLAAVWSGRDSDEFARDVAVGTAALALDTLGRERPQELAASLWEGRA